MGEGGCFGCLFLRWKNLKLAYRVRGRGGRHPRQVWAAPGAVPVGAEEALQKQVNEQQDRRGCIWRRPDLAPSDFLLVSPDENSP